MIYKYILNHKMANIDIQMLMSIIDENREKFKENTYLEICNLMKNIYVNDDNKSDDEELYYVRIKYRDGIYNIIKKDKFATTMFEDLVIMFSDTTEYQLDRVHSMVQAMIFDKLSCTSLMKIIQNFGGKKQGHKKMKAYIKDDYERYVPVYQKKSRREQLDIMAYHIIDHWIYEYVYINDYTSTDTVHITELYKICKHMYEH